MEGWLALALAFAAAVLVAGGVFYGLVVLLDVKGIDGTAKLDASTLFELVKLLRRGRRGRRPGRCLPPPARRRSRRPPRTHTRLHTERFSQAVDKLGSDSPAVRLGASTPWPASPTTPPTPATTPPTRRNTTATWPFAKSGTPSCASSASTTDAPQGTHRSWQGCDLDLTDVTIDGTMDFRGATFSGSTRVLRQRDVLRRHRVLRRRNALRRLGVLQLRDGLRRHDGLQPHDVLRRHGVLHLHKVPRRQQQQGDLRRRDGAISQWASYCRRHSCSCDSQPRLSSAAALEPIELMRTSGRQLAHSGRTPGTTR